MTILPDYLYSKILNEIIVYIYKNKLKRFYLASIWSFDNTEVLQYCISKRFFYIISNLLLEHLSFDNYRYLKYLIKDIDQDSNGLDNSGNSSIANNNSNSNNNNNNKYKLIKINNKIKVYKSLKEYECDNNSKLYNKVLVNINNEEDSSAVLDNYNTYPNNCKFTLFLNSQDLIEREFPSLPSSTSISTTNNNNNSINNNNINNSEIINLLNIKFIYIYFIDFEHTRSSSLWNKISKLAPKEFISFSVGQSDFTNLLTIKSIKSLSIPSLDKLIDFSKLDNLNTSIRKLSISIFYHAIIKMCNEDIDFKCFFSNKISQLNKQELKEYWCSIVKALSNNSTIRELVLSNKCNITLDESRYSNGCSIIKNSLFSGSGICSNSDDCGDDSDGYGIESKDLDLSFINKGFETIFKSKILKLESLAIHNFNFIDSTFLSSLEKNKTIKNLVLKHTNILPFFKYVLSSNRVIRNLVIEYSDNDFIELEYLLNLLKQDSSLIDLYSISVIINCSNDNQEVLELIKKNQSSLSNIKEFNIYNIKQSKIRFQFLKLNNTIITYQSKNL